jgi:type I restriction enzyme S subunit
MRGSRTAAAGARTQRADKLTQSILAKAFRAELVPTEAELARREGRSLPAPRPGVWFVYAIRCDDDSLYIGQTQDLAKRWEEHLAGRGADWTRQHRPVHVAHYEEVRSREAAVQREKWLKTGFGRKWLKREIAAGRARQAGYEPASVLLARIKAERQAAEPKRPGHKRRASHG